MASFLELFAPQWSENQRLQARQRFQAGLQQPQMFRMDDMPIPITPQLRQDYEKGFGIPYPARQVQPPTAGMSGMTFDPNRQQEIQQPVNMEVEYIPPRTAQEMALRGADIQGQALGQKRTSEYDFYRDLGEDYFGDDDIDLPSTVGFQRYEPAPLGESEPQYGERVWDPKVGAYVQSAEGEPDKWSPKASAGEPGSGKDPQEQKFKENLDSYKAITGKVGRINPTLAMMMGQQGSRFFENPSNVQQLQGILTPLEQKIVQMNLQYLEGHFSTQSGGNDPMGIR
jgi:hypothetical protein